MVTTTAQKRKSTGTTTATGLAERAQAHLDGCDDYRAACGELERLRINQASSQSELDQLRAELGDRSELLAKIESGQSLDSADGSDRLKILRDQVSAFDVAISRAEDRRQAVLLELSAKISPEFEALHRERMRTICEALETIINETCNLTEIPNALERLGLTADATRFPRFHFVDLQMFGPRAKYLSADYRLFLGGK